VKIGMVKATNKYGVDDFLSVVSTYIISFDSSSGRDGHIKLFLKI
jgi:hypothetical protein